MGNTFGYENDYSADASGPDVVPKNSSNGRPCTGVGGFFDLPPDAKKFTPCAKEDITAAAKAGSLKCLPKSKFDKLNLCSSLFNHLSNIPNMIVKCPEDRDALCPFVVKHDKTACSKPWVNNTCERSCGPPNCAKKTLANAVLPENGSLCKTADATKTTTMTMNDKYTTTVTCALCSPCAQVTTPSGMSVKNLTFSCGEFF